LQSWKTYGKISLNPRKRVVIMTVASFVSTLKTFPQTVAVEYFYNGTTEGVLNEISPVLVTGALLYPSVSPSETVTVAQLVTLLETVNQSDQLFFKVSGPPGQYTLNSVNMVNGVAQLSPLE
jgi:hypothetical protein